VRIVGGELKGRGLVAPGGLDVRPTSDRVREAIFNILVHGAHELKGSRVLDLFAGSGALGLEALSRGASFALFIEEAAAARGAIRRNIEALSLTGRTRTFRRDATRLGPITAGIAPFDFAFLDPPYDRGLVAPALGALAGGFWLAPGALAVAETRDSEEIEIPAGFELADERLYGETKIRFLNFTSAGVSTSPSG
jgi:16S rRNA (guanine966-N2)-methyltransferase